MVSSTFDNVVSEDPRMTEWEPFSVVRNPMIRTTRLFHLNDPITAENRKQYISDGLFFDKVSDVCQ
jgi:hypothetical protein